MHPFRNGTQGGRGAGAGGYITYPLYFSMQHCGYYFDRMDLPYTKTCDMNVPVICHDICRRVIPLGKTKREHSFAEVELDNRRNTKERRRNEGERTKKEKTRADCEANVMEK